MYSERARRTEFSGLELSEEIFTFGGLKLDRFPGLGLRSVRIRNLGRSFSVLLLSVLFLLLSLSLAEKKNLRLVFGVIISSL